MKRFLNIFFVTLGVIFFLLILAGIYFYVADPLELKPLFGQIFGEETASTTEESATPTGTTDKHPLLSASQEQALEKVGINPATLPTTITPAMEQCFYEKLGATRATEMKLPAPEGRGISSL
ncbi:MAG: hypothetical protein CO030_01570 [Candidatus Magasanikbacteria bacterium CG_4_9_14_0_2_um_filter_42_11]|uniref:Uncharacterized protein n=1 Tax=Candidatus Magasanikbacteria bacterium CG_4_9_14_0_2_um_filter_42_11 TaxID=1974643 RepID=A0A2M8FAE0_9BACT|nr:MAG: hypothetical protein COY70_00275 [Candidatus Magasanikbacteria bacterium CG_4_10_14_0_8_um_filter_42_12]PJC52678.1 MAG: hypothetical protein CO030_01570 [Candidatus Magasanikbacteria bacterium CG_4_9_14_0_2_um_filter_42_11]